MDGTTRPLTLCVSLDPPSELCLLAAVNVPRFSTMLWSVSLLSRLHEARVEAHERDQHEGEQEEACRRQCLGQGKKVEGLLTCFHQALFAFKLRK